MRVSEFKKEHKAVYKKLQNNGMIEEYWGKDSLGCRIKLAKDLRTRIDQEGFPIVTSLHVDHFYHIFIICPWCGNIHIHGISKSLDDPGWRTPHCGRLDFKDYYIKKED